MFDAQDHVRLTNNSLTRNELPALLRAVHDVLNRTAGSADTPTPSPVQVKKSVTPDDIVCLEDGKKFKSLKRHLRSHVRVAFNPGCRLGRVCKGVSFRA